MADANALVDFIAKRLVEEPEEVEVTEEDGKLLLLVTDEDLGRIIGRRGRTAKSIRTLLGIAYDRELEIDSFVEDDEDVDDDDEDLDDEPEDSDDLDD